MFTHTKMKYGVEPTGLPVHIQDNVIVIGDKKVNRLVQVLSNGVARKDKCSGIMGVCDTEKDANN